MRKVNFCPKSLLKIFSFKVSSLLSLLVLLILISGCGKTKKYINNQTYDVYVDTATLVVKITNTDYLPVDVAIQPTRLLLFDSKNLYYDQISSEKISNNDTSITVNGIPMGHYTALLIVDVPGTTNLNYLTKGKQSYQNVMDTLQYLLADTYVASTQSIIVNNKINTGSINFQPLISLVSQVSFDLSSLMNNDIWQNPDVTKHSLYFLVFQNNTLVMSRSVKNEDIQNGIYQIPIAKGANYSFMFTDLVNESNSPANIDSIVNGKSTPVIVQQKLEDEIDNIRMGNVPSGNLIKSQESYKVTNSIASIPVVLSGTTTPKQWSNPTDCDGWNLLVFGENGYLNKKIIQPANPITSNPSPKDALIVKVFVGGNYTFLAIGNAENAVGYYQQQNMLSPITPYYILNGSENLQKRQDQLYAWIAVDSGIMSSRLVNGQFKMTPEIRLNFNKMQEMSIAEVRKQTGNYFKENPRKVVGIVTSIGKVVKGINENPMSNIVILQDGQNAAIPIQFKETPKELNIGDQVTIALQDGSFTNTNSNANNVLVLENVTYTEVSKIAGSISNLPTAKELTLAEAKDPTIYAKYESMLVTVKDLEFRWFKDVTYGKYIPDSMILRDANAITAPASKLPKERNTINMMVSKDATNTFAEGNNVPVGKCSIKGFLTRTSTGNKHIAIMPQTNRDINSPKNELEERVDKGVIIKWNTNNGSNKEDKVYAIGETAGMAREDCYVNGKNLNTVKQTTSGYSTGNFPLYGIYSMNWTNSSNDAAVLIHLNTQEAANAEFLQFSFSCSRGGGNIGSPSMTFKVQYSIDGGHIYKPVKDDAGNDYKFTMQGTYGLSHKEYTSKPIILTDISRYDDVIISIGYDSGSSNGTSDKILSFYNIQLNQF